MLRDRRMLGLVLVVLLVGAPAAVLRALCVGRSCDRPKAAQADVPFCSLPEHARNGVQAGYRDGRSPDLLVVTESPDVRGAAGVPKPAPAWPSSQETGADRVPLAFHGAGVASGSEVQAGTVLDAVAPTVAEILGFERPFPDLRRSGEAATGVAEGRTPRLVVLVAWKGVGSDELDEARGDWPGLEAAMREGAGTLDARVGSAPLDPTAVLTTVGTGGLPRQHGITGTTIRGDDGLVTRAWTDEWSGSVIAALGDDLDAELGQGPRVGLVAMSPSDRGLTGGTWYVDHDADDLVIVRRGGPARVAARVEALLETGYGSDEVPDLLGVTMHGEVAELDQALRAVMAAAELASGGSVAVAVTSTGSVASDEPHATGEEVVEALEVEVPGTEASVEAIAMGGLFLDPEAQAEAGVPDDRMLRGLRDLPSPGGGPLVADAFSGIAVSLARYC